MTTENVTTGHAPVNDLDMYYEIRNADAGGTPLLLLHGGLFDIDQQWEPLLPGLSDGRHVIAVDFQAHGRTNDVEGRPLSTAQLASDVLGVLAHLGVAQADVFGFSVGGAVALHLAVRNPEVVRKLVASSISFHPDGDRGENSDATASMSVDMIAGTPMEAAYLAKSPHPDKEHLQTLLDKLGGYQNDPWSDDDIAGYPAPTLITVGDCDAVKLEHSVKFLQLRGGDVNGDFTGVPATQLAVFPGSTHFFGLSRVASVVDSVTAFLDAPMPGDQPEGGFQAEHGAG